MSWLILLLERVKMRMTEVVSEGRIETSGGVSDQSLGMDQAFPDAVHVGIIHCPLEAETRELDGNPYGLPPTIPAPEDAGRTKQKNGVMNIYGPYGLKHADWQN